MRGSRLRLCAALAAVSLSGCISQPLLLPPAPAVPLPQPADVERVVFLLGDPGTARATHYPILPVLRNDIEWWSQRLEADSAVMMFVLGDIVYPLGLHPPGSEEYPGDSAIVMDQVQLLAGPAAVERGARGFFLPGNHDWGLEHDWEGFVRLKTLSDFLGMAREETGAHVQLAPEAGTGGPMILDLGRQVRFLLLDTAWWLLEGGRLTAERQDDVLAGVDEAMRTAGDREVIVLAHHPFRSAGPHGGEFSFFRTFGLRYLLARSGAILQDVTSVPYRELERGLREIFRRRGTPLAFIGGHEHSLQVLGPLSPTDPNFNIVSGAGSKLSKVGAADAMYFGRSQPGYMRLVFEKGGGVTLFVVAAPEDFRACPTGDPERAECMQAGMAAFATVYSHRLR
jgi:hypothetical protein